MKVIVPILRRLGPEGVVEGVEFCMCNPRRPDEHAGSFKFNIQSGAWADFAMADTNGAGPASFVAYVENIPIADAFQRLEAVLGMKPWRPSLGDRWRPLSSAERSSAPPSGKAAEAMRYTPLAVPPEREHEVESWAMRVYRGRVERWWSYRDAQGRMLFAIVRRLSAARPMRKIFTPACWAVDTRFPQLPPNWIEKQLWPRPLPLYRLEALARAPDAPVIVTEGEKAADAAARIFPKAISTTSPNGAKAAAKADWSPLRGRDVLLWPDNDEPGRAYMTEVAAVLMPLGCRVRVVDAARLADQFASEDKRAGWDAADALPMHEPEALRAAALATLILVSASGDAGTDSAPEASVEPGPDSEAASSLSYEDLLARAQELAANDDSALCALAHDAGAAALSEARLDKLMRAAATATGFALSMVRKLFVQAKPAVTPPPVDLDAEREKLWQVCRELANAPDLMSRVEAMGDRLGVVGEGAAVRSNYLTMTSRLLRDGALSSLRRGAPAGGKNHLIGAVLRLMPAESVIRISGASPTALIYYGDSDDALAHKIVVIAEAAAIAAKANGDENPTTVLLRTLLSEGQIDRLVTVPQRDGVATSVHIRRTGPVALILTSARENVDPEMLTRLMTSDVDESREQTLAIVKRSLVSAPAAVGAGEIGAWLALQRWLAIDAPYSVSVPFAERIYKAYAKLVDKFPRALQVRMRRDVGGLLAAIKASAVLHKAQRDRDGERRIVAALADYRHAWSAFNSSVSSLYGVRTRAEIVALVRAAESLGAVKGGESVKITVAAMRKALGINSNDVAANRLAEAVEHGALEEDDSKRGTGRGSPRFFKLLISSADLKAQPELGVFPRPAEVRK
jgi:hypothetical protein